MPYLPNLSFHTPTTSSEEDAKVTLRNMGWLGRGHEFRTGDVSPLLVPKLLVLAENVQGSSSEVVNCDFCDAKSPIPMASPDKKTTVQVGVGEIRVRVDAENIYVAPSLVIHYIVAHHYRAPYEFERAALRIAARRLTSAVLDGALVSDAIITWFAFDSLGFPTTDDERLIDRYDQLLTVDLLPVLEILYEEFSACAAEEKTAGAAEPSAHALNLYRDRHPEISDEAIEIFNRIFQASIR